MNDAAEIVAPDLSRSNTLGWTARTTGMNLTMQSGQWARAIGRPVRPVALRPARMEPALLLAFLFPPPASGAFRLAGRYRTRAWCAADGRKALRVKRADREVVAGHEGQQLFSRPVEQRIELDQSAPGFGGDKCHVLAMRGLLGAQACNPGAGAGKRTLERFDLPHGAT